MSAISPHKEGRGKQQELVEQGRAQNTAVEKKSQLGQSNGGEGSTVAEAQPRPTPRRWRGCWRVDQCLTSGCQEMRRNQKRVSRQTAHNDLRTGLIVVGHESRRAILQDRKGAVAQRKKRVAQFDTGLTGHGRLISARMIKVEGRLRQAARHLSAKRAIGSWELGFRLGWIPECKSDSIAACSWTQLTSVSNPHRFGVIRRASSQPCRVARLGLVRQDRASF